MLKFNIVNLNNNQYYTRLGYNKMSFSDKLDTVIKEVKDKISKPSNGYFRSFAEDIQCSEKNIYGRSVSLCVERDEVEEGKALLLVSLLHPTLNKEASVMLVNGDRNRILEYMNDKNFKSNLEKAVLELSESLKKQG